MLAEWFSGKRRRNSVGLMTAALGAGYLLTSVVNFWLGLLGWRVVLLTGIVPALIAFYVRTKLSEPEASVAGLNRNPRNWHP